MVGDEAQGDEAQAATGRLCPACGVNVAAGYPRCPKCHTAMPGEPATASAPPAHQAMVAGGTSAADAGSGLLPWIAGGVGVGVLAIVLVMTLGGGGNDDATPAGGATTAPSVEPGGEDVGAPAGGGGGLGGDRIDVDDTVPDDEPSAAETIRLFDAALRGRNLWSQVRDDGDGVLVIQSSLCEDPGMAEVLAEESPSLAEVGFATAQCVAPHGGVVFERGL